MKSKRGKTYISSGILLPSKVINLVIKRPFHFCFRPGDYVFINIPAIAKYEWHPFTLSSAPEQDGKVFGKKFSIHMYSKIISILDHICLHIRAVGEWTNRLLNFFEKEQERLHNGEVAAYIPGTSSGGLQISNIMIEDEADTMKKKMGLEHRSLTDTDAISRMKE